MVAYSERKYKVNPAPPYSILNPDTNSLSPSDKSKGARLVSDKIKTKKNIINKGPAIIRNNVDLLKKRLPQKKRGENKAKNRATSYLTD